MSFKTIYNAVQGRKNGLLIILLGVTLLSGVGLLFIPFDDTLDQMLPEGSDIQEAGRLLRDTDLAGKVIIWLTNTSDDQSSQAFIEQAVDVCASLNTPLIQEIITGASGSAMFEDLQFFMESMPGLLDQTDLNMIDQQLNPEAVDHKLKEWYRQLLKPQSTFVSSMLRHDPLGLSGAIYKRIQAMSSSFGYDLKIKDGQFVSQDERHVMIILETPVSLTDNAGSIELLDYLSAQFETLPAWIRSEVICGHEHTVSNQRVVQTDIQRTVTVAAIVFLLLFLLLFRDIRAVLVFIIPAASVLVAINVANLLMGPLTLLVVGLCAFIAGIAIDYGIHMYIAVRNGGHDVSVVRKTAGPVCLGAFTTISVFVAFLFSHTNGYRQLGVISMISIAISLAYAIYVLPLFVRQKEQAGLLFRSHLSLQRSVSLPARWLSWFFVLLLIPVGWCLLDKVPFDSDIAHLDGADTEIVDAETAFFDLWGGGVAEQGLCVVTHSDYSEALRLSDRIYDALNTEMGTNAYISFAAIWPDEERREQHVKQWNRFWWGERDKKLRRLLKEQGMHYGFNASAFDPFFDTYIPYTRTVTEPTKNKLFSTLKDRFVSQVDGAWQIISFFPDTDEYVNALERITDGNDAYFVLSRRAVYQTFSGLMSHEVRRISTIALGMIIVVTILFLKKLRWVVFSLVPAVSGVVGMLGVMAIMHHPLNAANLIAGIVVVGLCIDYGIFITYACGKGLDSGVGVGVTLSAITTLAGAGVLLLAQHPALFSVGLTLSAGVGSGYVVAIIIVPALAGKIEKVGSDQ